MDGCWPVALISLGVPTAAATLIFARQADQWQLILLGWGLSVLFLLSLLAGTQFAWPASFDEMDIFERIVTAFAVTCGPLPWFGGIGLGVAAGGLIHEATKEKQA